MQNLVLFTCMSYLLSVRTDVFFCIENTVSVLTESMALCLCVRFNQVAAYNSEGKSNPSQVVEFITKPDRPSCPCRPVIKGRVQPDSFKMAWGELLFKFPFIKPLSLAFSWQPGKSGLQIAFSYGALPNIRWDGWHLRREITLKSSHTSIHTHAQITCCERISQHERTSQFAYECDIWDFLAAPGS